MDKINCLLTITRVHSIIPYESNYETVKAKYAVWERKSAIKQAPSFVIVLHINSNQRCLLPSSTMTEPEKRYTYFRPCNYDHPSLSTEHQLTLVSLPYRWVRKSRCSKKLDLTSLKVKGDGILFHKSGNFFHSFVVRLPHLLFVYINSKSKFANL